MRKTCITAVSLLSLLSCQNRMEVDIPAPGAVLIMNASLLDTDQNHSIFLSMGGSRTYSTPVNDATVTCFVNGELVARAERDATDYGGLASEYKLDFTFKPGDKVRVVAEREEMEVYAEVVVPERSSLELVDSSATRMGTEAGSTEVLDVRFKIKKASEGLCRYRLGTVVNLIDQINHYYDKGGNRLYNDVNVLQYNEVKSHIGGDPILNDGYMPSNSTDDFNILDGINPHNKLRSFTSAQFSGGEAEVRISVERWKDWLYSMEDYKIFDDNGNVYTLSSADVKRYLLIGVECISSETYNYYKALNAGASTGYEGNFLAEPVIIPSNVTGGLGFVSASSVASLPLLTRDAPWDGSVGIYTEK